MKKYQNLFRAIAVAAVLTAIFGWPYSGSYWRATWAMPWYASLTAVAAWFAVEFFRANAWEAIPLLLCVFLGGFGVVAFPAHEGIDQIAFNRAAMGSMLTVALVSVFFVTQSTRRLTILLDGFGLFAVADAVLTLCQYAWLRQPYVCGGLLGNASMNGGFLAIFSVLVLPRWYFLGPIILAVLSTNASMAYGTLFVAQAIRNLPTTPKARAWYPYAVALAAPVLVFMLGHEAFSSTGRWDMWKMALEYWQENGGLWFGFGPGSAELLLPHIQELNGFKGPAGWFIFMHNDWLQILFELGVTGFAAAVLLYLTVLRWAAWDRKVFAAVLAYGAFAMGNYPLREAPTAFLGAMLVSVAFHRKLVYGRMKEASNQAGEKEGDKS